MNSISIILDIPASKCALQATPPGENTDTHYSFRVKFISERRKKETKKEDEKDQNFHTWFSNLIKVSGTYTVDLAIE